MDRKLAQENIGKLIVINEGQEGSYVGILNEIIAPPRKTWRGTVTIRAVAELPAPEKNGDEPSLTLKYIENEVIECIGSKLDLLEDDEELAQLSFQESIEKAASERFLELDNKQKEIAAEQKLLAKDLASFGVQNDSFLPDETDEDENEPAVFYTFKKVNGRFVLVDEQDEVLDLEDCPFEFNWYDEQAFLGHYEGNGTFISNDGTRFTPEEGTTFSISEKQFEPYFILQNELEPEALHSLEKNLQSFGLTHEHMIECHNTLLGQFLYADGKKTFKGVNFLTYRNHQGVVLVQHHFERKLQEHTNDEIYDRFEFTAENGKRAIATFTNDYSK